jgi:hypothetical protein
MRASIFLLFLSALASSAAAQQQSLGIFGTWGAFQKSGRCYAITEPYRGPKAAGWRAHMTVTFDPARGARGQVYFRLGRVKRGGSAVLLRIDDKTFQLAAGGADAWGADSRADAEIVAAMRIGLEMSVETRTEQGGLLHESYRLRGAATAIDAAAIACARR